MPQGEIISRGVGGRLEPSITVLVKKEERRQRARALRLLQKASIAAQLGKTDRSKDLRRQATVLIGKDEVAVICEENRLTFSPRRNYEFAPARQTRHGFAST